MLYDYKYELNEFQFYAISYPKLPAEIRVSHLNARINEQRKKIAQTTASKLRAVATKLNNYQKKRAHVKKNNQKIYVIDFNGDTAASAVDKPS